MRANFKKALRRAAENARKPKPAVLLKEDILNLLTASDGEEMEALFNEANDVRALWVGDEVHLRALLEFSNHCMRDCLYCGLRASNSVLKRYRMTPEQIVDLARKVKAMDFKTIVLQSGEDFAYDRDTVSWMVREIKKMGLAITLSLGERVFQDYRAWKEAGAHRYLLKLETSDAALHARLRPGRTFEDRFQCLRWLKELGYQTGSGNMIGLPGQSLETIADDIALMAELRVDMAGIGPFIPNPETPLGGCPQGDIWMTLKAVAVARLAMPWAHLPATTATGTIHPQGREMALQRGANVVMPDITPVENRKEYRIYPNKMCLFDEADHCRVCIEGKIRALGRRVAKGYGHALALQDRQTEYANGGGVGCEWLSI